MKEEVGGGIKKEALAKIDRSPKEGSLFTVIGFIWSGVEPFAFWLNPFEKGMALVSAERPRVAAWLTEAWRGARDASPLVVISPFAYISPRINLKYAEMKASVYDSRDFFGDKTMQSPLCNSVRNSAKKAQAGA